MKKQEVNKQLSDFSTELLKLTPFLVKKIWGHHRLAQLKNLDLPDLGESWEVSLLSEGQSKFNDLPLGELIYGHEDKFLGPAKQLSYLVKFIDTADNLSIQVHPDDQFAIEHENSKGKDECWIILEAQQNAGIFLGTRPDVDKAQLEMAIAQKKDISKLLNFHPVKVGDFYFLPAGTVHAIGKNIMLLEIQKSSGITYRVWDWDRTDNQGKTRELHIEKALQVINFNHETSLHDLAVKNIYQSENTETLLLSHGNFNVKYLSFPNKKNHKISDFSHRPRSIIGLKGSLTITCGNSKQVLNAFESIFIPYSANKELTINSHGDASCVLVF